MLHTGAIAAIADVAIGHALAALTDPPTSLVTVNPACDLLGGAHLGEWVDGSITPTRVGRRPAAGSATFTTDRAIAVITALFIPVVPVVPVVPGLR